MKKKTLISLLAKLENYIPEDMDNIKNLDETLHSRTQLRGGYGSNNNLCSYSNNSSCNNYVCRETNNSYCGNTIC